MERLGAIKTQLGQVFGRFSGGQKLGLLLALVATVGLMVLIIISASSTTYRPLFTDLPPESLSRVAQALDSRGIPYRLDGDTAISVPDDMLYEARIQLAGDGLPDVEGAGFELFDEAEFGMTAFTQRVNYQRAMESELARTVRQIHAVRSARVHLVMPEQTLFRDDQEPPSASVIVGVNSGMSLDQGQIQSIRYLVSSAVEGMEPGQVTIVDSSGRMLARSSDEGGSLGGLVDSSDSIEAAASIEHDLEDRIISLLSPVVGASNVRASVRVELDTSETVETTEAYDPEALAIRSEDRSEETTSRGDTGVAGAPGVVANLPGGDDAVAAASINESSRAEEHINYEINTTIRQTTYGGLRIRRISAAVLIDEHTFLHGPEVVVAAEGADEDDETEEGSEDDAAEAAPVRAQEDVDRLAELVKNAIGFDATRGDRVMVTLEAFGATALLLPEDEPFWANPGIFISVGKYALLLIVALLLALFVIRPVMAQLLQTTDVVGETQMVVRTVKELEGEYLNPDIQASRKEEAARQLDAQERLRLQTMDLGNSDLDRTSQVISQWIRMDVH